MLTSNLTRREFLATSTAAIATASTGASATDHKSGDIRIGLLGPGHHGTDLLHAMDALGPEHNAMIVAIHRDSLDAVSCANLDGVIIATPDHLHAETSVAAIEAGLHVYCASPMARAEPEAAAVRDAARASNCIYQVGGETVFEPRWRAARALVQAGVIGDVRWCSGTATAIVQDHESSGDWKTNSTCTHGHAAHYLNELWATCAFVTGAQNPVTISAMGGSYQSEEALPDALSLSADFEHGLHFNLDCNPERHTAPHAVIRGSTGSLIIERDCIAAMPESLGGADVSEVWRTDNSPAPTALEEWLTCIRTGHPCTFNAELGYEASTTIARAMDAYHENITT